MLLTLVAVLAMPLPLSVTVTLSFFDFFIAASALVTREGSFNLTFRH